jgi:uncharacterized membrane protein YGL010W
MRWDVALALRLLAHVGALIIGLGIGLVSVVAIIIALFGTGALTADPPPAHANIFGAVVVVAICVVAESLLVWGWRRIVHILDAAEAR